MPKYEHVFICRQDLTSVLRDLAEEFKGILTENGGRQLIVNTGDCIYCLQNELQGKAITFCLNQIVTRKVSEMERLMNT